MRQCNELCNRFNHFEVIQHLSFASGLLDFAIEFFSLTFLLLHYAIACPCLHSLTLVFFLESSCWCQVCFLHLLYDVTFHSWVRQTLRDWYVKIWPSFLFFGLSSHSILYSRIFELHLIVGKNIVANNRNKLRIFWNWQKPSIKLNLTFNPLYVDHQV